MSYLARRSVNLCMAAAYSDQLQIVDAAVEVLEKDDHEAVKQTKKSMGVMKDELAEFNMEFHAKWQTFKMGPEAKRRKIVKSIVPDTAMSQADAKGFCPIGGSIWGGWVREEWCGHYPPFARVSCGWNEAGSEHAAQKWVLRALWVQHLFLKGRPLTDCPFRGIF